MMETEILEMAETMTAKLKTSMSELTPVRVSVRFHEEMETFKSQTLKSEMMETEWIKMDEMKTDWWKTSGSEAECQVCEIWSEEMGNKMMMKSEMMGTEIMEMDETATVWLKIGMSDQPHFLHLET